MQERDRRTERAVPRLFVDQPDVLVTQRRERSDDVVHGVADVMNAFAALLEELPDRGVRSGWLQQLDVGRPQVRRGDREHRLLDALRVVAFATSHAEAERRGVERHRAVEVAHREADVIDACEQRLGHAPYRGSMPGSVIVSGARTPIGKLLGSLGDLPAVDLGGVAIEAALSRAGITGDDVDYVVMGQVLQAGTGQITARQAAVKGGVPMAVPALTINKVCLSGLDAIALADQLISAGEFDVVVAGGMESMTLAPHLLPRSRTGVKYGNTTLVDSMQFDGLWDAFTDEAMGELTESCNGSLGISRQEQDEYSARSHELAAAAQKDGRFDDEIVPVPVPQRRGDPVLVTADEGVRPETTVEALAKLKPAFGRDGTITAGSSSQISDGACAVVVMSRTAAERLGAPVLAEIGHHGVVAGPDSTLQAQPANAIQKAVSRAGLSVSDLDVIEINEAFAAVAVHSARQLGVAMERVNPNGGAIALGHPIGMSGARIALTLVHELRRRGGGLGAAALCGGGGQGDALL